MTAHEGDRLAELALGTLSADETRDVEAHLASCRRCLDEAVAVAETFASLALALPPVAPSPELRARLLASVEPNRFERFVDRVAGALEVARERARELLAGIDQPASWSPSPVATAKFYHLVAGPRHVAAQTVTGFVRVTPGTTFPNHIHVGREHVLVVQGGFTDGLDGKDYRAGDDAYQEAGTAHALHAHAGDELIYLAVVDAGVVFDPPFEF